MIFEDVMTGCQPLIEDSQRLAESIVETVREPIVVLDADLRVRLANRAFYQTFRMTKAETEGVQFFSLGSCQWEIPELRSLLLDILPRDTRVHDLEIEQQFPRLGQRTMLLNARRLDGRASAPEMILLAIEDITERRRAEEELKKSEERFQLVARATNDAVYDWDLLTNEFWWNASFFKMFGYRAEEIEPTVESWTSRIHPDDSHRMEREIRELIESGGKTWSGEYRFRRADGSFAIVFDRTYVWHTEDGRAIRLLGSVMDISERKQIEQQLKIFASKLERSNRELQDFASVASHDLQEPLRKIQAFGDRLKAKYHDSLGAEGRDFLERMQSAAARMQTLINDLLMFSRVETRAQPFIPVNLSQIVREVAADLEVQVDQTGATIEIGGLPVIEADPLQMRQLLQNLIGNSLKYRRPDLAPVIKVHAVVTSDRRLQPKPGATPAGRLCQLHVEDNGIGFDEKYLDRIFVVFQRLHGRKEYEGTGVGLAVCRKIVERHGGHITAHSSVGSGANFVVTLPVTR